jgi:hypothetical protein
MSSIGTNRLQREVRRIVKEDAAIAEYEANPPAPLFRGYSPCFKPGPCPCLSTCDWMPPLSATQTAARDNLYAARSALKRLLT